MITADDDQPSRVTAEWIRDEARFYEGKPVGPVGPASPTITEHLKSPWGAYVLITSVFPRGGTTLDHSLPPQIDGSKIPPNTVL